MRKRNDDLRLECVNWDAEQPATLKSKGRNPVLTALQAKAESAKKNLAASSSAADRSSGRASAQASIDTRRSATRR